METETKEVKTQRRDQEEVVASRKKEELDVVGKLIWTDKIFLRSNSIK